MELDCHICTEQQKEVRGCTEETGQLYINREVYKRCPLKIIPGYIYDYLEAYRMYKSGHLPGGKSWLDESKKFLTAMSVIDSEVYAIESTKK